MCWFCAENLISQENIWKEFFAYNCFDLEVKKSHFYFCLVDGNTHNFQNSEYLFSEKGLNKHG